MIPELIYAAVALTAGALMLAARDDWRLSQRLRAAGRAQSDAERARWIMEREVEPIAQFLERTEHAAN